MRVAKWKADQIFMDAKNAALDAVREAAEQVAAETRRTVHVDTKTFREPKFSDQLRDVSFVPTKGRGKGTLVSFKARVWLGRKPGDLRRTIRTVEKPDNPGNIRVIAGNFKIYWARFAEYGVPSRKIRRSMFMRNAFDGIKTSVAQKVADRVKGVTR